LAQIDFLQVKSGNISQLPVLADSELGWAEDVLRLFIGTSSGINAPLPNALDITSQNSKIQSAIDVSTTSSNNIFSALEISNTAKATADASLQQSESTQAQVANIIVNNSNNIPTELVDMRINDDGLISISSGEHIRDLDRATDVLKNLQSYTANIVTSSIPIAPAILALIDITKTNMDIYYLGYKLQSDNYTINTTTKTINLTGWSLAVNEVIEYRVYK